MLRQMLNSGKLVVAPGVFDGFSAMMARELPFEAVYMGGYCVAASRYGLPDAGLIGLSEMLEGVRLMAQLTGKPVIADGDTGYGGLLNIQHTVRSYEAAGAAAIHIEDQEMPKKCGHTQGKRVVAQSEMVAKVEVAIESRRSDDFVIIARTDSLATHGIDEAIKRCKAYKAAGADIVFIDALDSMENIERAGGELGGALMANITPVRKEFQTPEISREKLQSLGYSIACYSGMFASAMLGGIEQAARYFQANGILDSANGPAISAHEMVGFGPVWADETRWAQKYG
jgi:2,3-dimethylmalate lyase